MKLTSQDIPTDTLLLRAEELAGRRAEAAEQTAAAEPAPRVDPVAYFLGGLEQNADPTQPLPLHTHRSGLGKVVLVLKWGFRKSCQVLINEVLARQRTFNGHSRDAYSHLSAEIARLRHDLDQVAGRGKP